MSGQEEFNGEKNLTFDEREEEATKSVATQKSIVDAFALDGYFQEGVNQQLDEREENQQAA
jgi:hypothetical protein